MAVLVTDGDQRSSLAVVRSLGRAGIDVVVGESSATSLAGSSRYASGTIRYPSPLQDSNAFLVSLRAELASGKYDVLLPMTDITVQLVASIRDSLPPSVRVPFPGLDQISRLQDKWRVLEIARPLGIACPQTCMLHENENIEEAVARFHYPVVIKPRMSRVLCSGKWIFGSIRYAGDPVSLAAQYRQVHKAIPFPMIQEKLEGEGRGVFLLIWNGELKAAFCHRRLREKPPWGGVSVYCESLPLDRDLVDKSAALLKAAGWQGVAMVEFKVDPRDGQPKLMEVNGRFWGSLQLAIDAGVDFPRMLYDCALGVEVTPQFNYRAGVKSRWLLGDLDNLMIRIRHPRGPDGVRYSTGSRWLACTNFLKFYEHDLHYEVMRWDDLRPGWHEIGNYIRVSWRRLRSRKEAA